MQYSQKWATIAAGVITTLIMGVVLTPIITSGSTSEAVSYLKTKDQGPWVTMALVAFGETPDVSYLKDTTSSTAIGLEAPILALAAAGKDPRSYPNMDLVAELKTYVSGGQIGDENTLNDDVFGILALIAAGESLSDPIITDTKQFILTNQNEDGGWGFSVGGSSDTNTTAAAIQALVATGMNANDSAIQEALAYLQGAQNNDGGFPYDPNSEWGTDSDASSSAWVIAALNALGIDPVTWSVGGNTPVSHLQSLQDDAGFFAYQTGGTEDGFSPVTTAYAVIALSGGSLPVGTYASPAQLVSFRIEGSSDTVCTGETYAQNALEVVEDAAGMCGFSYNISETSFGPYLDQIGSDTAEGLIGWLYRVNSMSPSVGAADYELQDGDSVLWFYGDFAWTPLRLSLSDTEVQDGEADATATVEVYTSGSWSTLEGATVALDDSSFVTDSSGNAMLDVTEGVYTAVAEKDGHIRSNSVLLVVGETTEWSVGLSATIGGNTDGDDGNESDQPGVIAFSVNPNDLSFGQIEPGSQSQDDVEITNDGDDMIRVYSDVSGDDVFRQFISLDDTPWRSWNTDIDSGSSHTAQIKLDIPSSYSESGAKNGDLIFWAIGGK